MASPAMRRAEGPRRGAQKNRRRRARHPHGDADMEADAAPDAHRGGARSDGQMLIHGNMLVVAT